MKVLLVTEFFPTGKDLKFSGGVEARTYFVGRELAKTHSVYIISSKIKGARTHELIDDMKVMRVGRPRNYKASAGDILTRINFILEAIKVGKTLDADIVDGSNFITHYIARKIANTNNIPTVAWYPDVWIGEWLKNVGISGIFGELLERLNLRAEFDAYIAISKNTAKKLKKFVKQKIHTIYCGVDLAEFQHKGIKFDTPTVICVSRLTKYKKIEDLIWAFASIVKSGRKANLLIIGRGPQENKLKEIVKMVNLYNHITFKSNLSRTELVKYFKSSHVFCLPSAVEGFGISVIEASAAGIPYIVSDIDVFKEITRNGQGGLLFKLGNIHDLVSKLDKLLSDKKFYGKKSKEALKLSKIYDWKQISKETEKVYKSLI